MKTLTQVELQQRLGEYVSPTGLYRYIKSLPFLGSLSSNVSSLTAGEWTEIVITYTVGGSGLADGAWIKGTFKFYSVSIFRSALLTFDVKRQLTWLEGLGFISNFRLLSRQLCICRISSWTTRPRANSSNCPRARRAI